MPLWSAIGAAAGGVTFLAGRIVAEVTGGASSTPIITAGIAAAATVLVALVARPSRRRRQDTPPSPPPAVPPPTPDPVITMMLDRITDLERQLVEAQARSVELSSQLTRAKRRGRPS